MAKKVDNEDLGLENPMEENAEQPLKDNAVEAKISNRVKGVKIRISEEVDCIIAGTPYKFAKDKEATVPADVAAILCYAKKAYRL